MKPLIGITVDAKPDSADARTKGSLTLNWNYAQVIADAGGVPLLIPPQADAATVATLIDGWLIPGGNDIDPKHWGEPLHPEAVLVEEARYSQEEAIYSLIPDDLPVLGICYGCQFINVVEGGSLIQHLPDVVGSSADQNGTLQQYSLEPSSKVAAALGVVQARGQSWHHQAVNGVAEGLQVVGRNEDGTIEALEGSHRGWLIGVQWHPERTPDADDSRTLFARFVEAAAAFRARRTE